jgi:hypothetical protein
MPLAQSVRHVQTLPVATAAALAEGRSDERRVCPVPTAVRSYP